MSEPEPILPPNYSLFFVKPQAKSRKDSTYSKYKTASVPKQQMIKEINPHKTYPPLPSGQPLLFS